MSQQNTEEGWPSEAQANLEHWKVIRPPETYIVDLPEEIESDDGPFAVQNINNGVVIGVEYVESPTEYEIPDDMTTPVWVVRGPNSVLYTESTLKAAQQELYQYVTDLVRPSGMV